MTDLILCHNLSINDRDSRVLTVQVRRQQQQQREERTDLNEYLQK